MKDPGENLGRQKGNRREGVAQRVEDSHRGTHFLINGGNGRNARAGVMNDGPEMIESGLDAGKYIGEHGRLHVT